MAETKILDLINSCGIYPQEWKNKEDVNQGAIDNIQDWVMGRVTPQDIAEHNCFAYSNSVKEYDSKQSNSLVVPEIVDFIDLMPENGLVLDLGAGHFRDSLYMVEPGCRKGFNRDGMAELEKRLRIVPLENSLEFLDNCSVKVAGNMDRIPLIVRGDFMTPGVGSAYFSRDKKLEEVFTKGRLESVLDGIWSCAAYMVHMASGKLGDATKNWAKTLKEGGVFAVSYINKKEGQGKMKMLASRSAPGEIKIFSHYDSGEVDRAFEGAGMKLIDRSTGDYDGHGHVMSGFFGNAMYRKKK